MFDDEIPYPCEFLPTARIGEMFHRQGLASMLICRSGYVAPGIELTIGPAVAPFDFLLRHVMVAKDEMPGVVLVPVVCRDPSVVTDTLVQTGIWIWVS